MAHVRQSAGRPKPWIPGAAVVLVLVAAASTAGGLGTQVGDLEISVDLHEDHPEDIAPASSAAAPSPPLPIVATTRVADAPPAVPLGRQAEEGDPEDAAASPAVRGTNTENIPVLRLQFNVQTREINVLGKPMEIWTYNGHVPEVVRMTEGTRVEVTLVNGHSQTHSLHTHFRGNLIGSDGSSDTAPFPFVPHQHNPTPIEQNPTGGPYAPRHDRDVADPGQSYTYTFFADTPGNFIFHCHVFLATDHIERGLFGVFVVYPKGWTWEEMPADELNGKTKARVWDDQGRAYYEDNVFITEVTPLALDHTGDASTSPPTGNSMTSEYPTAVPTSGFTPAATGKIHLANYRAWNDPYMVGPVQPNERIILRVINLGDEMHDWHVHAHWFDIIDKTSRAWKPLLTDDTWLLGPGDSIMTMMTAGNPGIWFMHDHIVPEAYTGMVPWLWIEGEPLPNVRPDITVDNLVDGAVVAGKEVILGTSDNFEGREMVTGVEIRVDGGDWQRVDGVLSWRYVWDTTALSDGKHTLAFRSFDGRDHSETTEMEVDVRNHAPASGNSVLTTAPAKSVPGLAIVAIMASVAATAWYANRRQ